MEKWLLLRLCLGGTSILPVTGLTISWRVLVSFTFFGLLLQESVLWEEARHISSKSNIQIWVRASLNHFSSWRAMAATSEFGTRRRPSCLSYDRPRWTFPTHAHRNLFLVKRGTNIVPSEFTRRQTFSFIACILFFCWKQQISLKGTVIIHKQCLSHLY